MTLASILLCIAGVGLLAVDTWRQRMLVEARRERDAARAHADALLEELKALRVTCRAYFAIEPRGSVRSVFAAIEQVKPAGVSMRECFDEMKRALDEGRYP